MSKLKTKLTPEIKKNVVKDTLNKCKILDIMKTYNMTQYTYYAILKEYNIQTVRQKYEDRSKIINYLVNTISKNPDVNINILMQSSPLSISQLLKEFKLFYLNHNQRNVLKKYLKNNNLLPQIRNIPPKLNINLIKELVKKNYTKSEICKELNISNKTLWYALKKYSIKYKIHTPAKISALPAPARSRSRSNNNISDFIIIRDCTISNSIFIYKKLIKDYTKTINYFKKKYKNNNCSWNKILFGMSKSNILYKTR